MNVKPYPVQEHKTGVLIIGAGGAGLRAAVEAAERGASVAVISKVPALRSHTVAAQGGINAALGNFGPDDWRWHAYDTMKGSGWLADEEAVNFMCERAPAAIAELEQMGMAFTRGEGGKIYQRAYGGQRADFGTGAPVRRACAVADRTGHALLHTLYTQAKKQGVHFFEEFIALDLLMNEDGVCAGVLAWRLEDGTIHAFRAPATILATGGFGQAYATTTASAICTGDGGGMALRAGLKLRDMEFVQFHPTGLYGAGVLITEGARGEGGHLVNAKGERFMERYAPDMMELAARDLISRAMITEIREGRGCGPKADHLHLRLDHLSAAELREKLPTVLDVAARFARIDAAREPISIYPTVHYTMGGIPTDVRAQALRTAQDGAREPVPGLYAAGEAACVSVHGANRLGCNSLLELAVFGKEAGAQAAEYAAALPSAPPAGTEAALSRFDRLRHASGSAAPRPLRARMQQAMQEHAGIIRSAEGIEAGRAALAALVVEYEHNLMVNDKSLIWNILLLEALELGNLLPQAAATLTAALARTESRGAHYREG